MVPDLLVRQREARLARSFDFLALPGERGVDCHNAKTRCVGFPGEADFPGSADVLGCALYFRNKPAMRGNARALRGTATMSSRAQVFSTDGQLQPQPLRFFRIGPGAVAKCNCTPFNDPSSAWGRSRSPGPPSLSLRRKGPLRYLGSAALISNMGPACTGGRNAVGAGPIDRCRLCHRRVGHDARGRRNTWAPGSGQFARMALRNGAERHSVPSGSSGPRFAAFQTSRERRFDATTAPSGNPARLQRVSEGRGNDGA